MNNQQREQESLNPETQEIARLEEQLREAVAAENFFETASGKLWTEIVTKEITRITNDITSDKYIKDHVGYVNAVSDLNANRKVLKRMQVAASPKRIALIKERLNPENA